ncbi:MAG: hypothetical protein AB8F26_02605 [Phycisphaerales bacterium]
MKLRFSITVGQMLSIASLADAERRSKPLMYMQSTGCNEQHAECAVFLLNPQPMREAFVAFFRTIPTAHQTAIALIADRCSAQQRCTELRSSSIVDSDLESVANEVLDQLLSRADLAKTLARKSPNELDHFIEGLVA